MKTDQQIRMAVKSLFGGKNAIVKRNGEIHVRGIMPNTSIYGWYLFGFTNDAQTEYRLFGISKQ